MSGIIYAITRERFERLKSGKDVFCKFVKGMPKVNVGDTLIFYLSGGSKEIVGEALIVEMMFSGVDSLMSRYGDRLFITGDELKQYANRRDTVLFFVLNDLKEYRRPFKMEKPLTMAGMNLTKELYKKITRYSK